MSLPTPKSTTRRLPRLLKGYREQILKQGCAAVSITGPDKVKLGEVIVLKAEVKLPVVPKTPPVYRFQWSDVRSGMRFADATETFKPKTTTAGDYQVKVEVFKAKNGAWERIGEAVHKLAVELTQVSIKGPVAAVPGEKVSFEAVTSLETAAQSTLRYAWRYVGSANILGTAQVLSWHGRHDREIQSQRHRLPGSGPQIGQAGRGDAHPRRRTAPSLRLHRRPETIDGGPDPDVPGQGERRSQGQPAVHVHLVAQRLAAGGQRKRGIPGARRQGKPHRPGRGLPGRRRQVAEGGRGQLPPRCAGALCNLHHQHGEGPDQGGRVDDAQRDHLGDQPHGHLPALLCLADRRPGRRHREQHLARGEQRRAPTRSRSKSG